MKRNVLVTGAAGTIGSEICRQLIHHKVKKIIAECEEFSESSPFPDTSVMYDVVYEQNDYPFIKHKLD